MFLQQINQLMFSLRQFQVLNLIQRDSNLEQQIFSIVSLRGNIKTKDQLVEVFCFSHSQFSQVYYLYQLSLLVSGYKFVRDFPLYLYQIVQISHQNSIDKIPKFSAKLSLVSLENSVQIQNFITSHCYNNVSLLLQC